MEPDEAQSLQVKDSPSSKSDAREDHEDFVTAPHSSPRVIALGLLIRLGWPQVAQCRELLGRISPQHKPSARPLADLSPTASSRQVRQPNPPRTPLPPPPDTPPDHVLCRWARTSA